MATLDDRVTILETEFRTELKHLATKADLERLKMWMIGTIVTVGAAVIAAQRFWN